MSRSDSKMPLTIARDLSKRARKNVAANYRRPNHSRGAASAPSKIAKMIALLSRPDGAALGELVRVTGWEKHSVRGAISGAIKGKLGHRLVSKKSDSIRRYRIVRPVQLSGKHS